MRYGAAGLKVDSTVCDKPLLGGNCMRCTPRLANGIGGAMRAVVYHGPGQKQWEEVADPKLVDDGDAIVRVDATTICGTDLHILKGDVPAVTPGRILGHEAVGTVMETGPGVRSLREGDRVLMSCISACGRCRY